MRSFRRVVLALVAGSLATLSACAPVIGDGCDTSTDCSVNGDRFCDTAQPGGYCTVIGCDPDTCPDDALCVEWRFEPTRSAETWCMRSCGNTGDCDRKGSYTCVRETDPELAGLARVIDLEVRRDESGFASTGFCAATNAP